MKTSNVLIRLCILVLVFTPLLTTTEASAQPCPPNLPCGTFPNCYAAPKVDCPDQLDHLIDHNCCDPLTVSSLCDPGLFICISTQIPEAWANCHNCSGAQDCKYIYIRNSTYCEGGAPYPKIQKVEFDITKDGLSSEYVMCGPKKQWGMDPWDDSTWSISTSYYGPIASGGCKSWTGHSTDVITTSMPPKGSSYLIETCNHYTAVLCGADISAIKVTYVMDASGTTHTTPWFNSLTVHSSPCPEYGYDHDWCP